MHGGMLAVAAIPPQSRSWSRKYVRAEQPREQTIAVQMPGISRKTLFE